MIMMFGFHSRSTKNILLSPIFKQCTYQLIQEFIYYRDQSLVDFRLSNKIRWRWKGTLDLRFFLVLQTDQDAEL